jgi:hypothetical protein
VDYRYYPALIVKGIFLAETFSGIERRLNHRLFRLQDSKKLVVVTADLRKDKELEVAGFELFDNDIAFLKDVVDNPECCAASLFKELGKEKDIRFSDTTDFPTLS